MKRRLYIFCGLLLFAAALVAACNSSGSRLFKETRSSMYTIVSITVVGTEDKVRGPIDKAYAELDRLAALMNFYDEKSEISQVNRNAGEQPVKVSAETFELVEKAVFTSEMTGGAFDVTVGPLVKLWDFKKGIIPEKRVIDEMRGRVGYRNIVLDKASSTIYLSKRGAQIDLGGILKGYAADKVVEMLRRSGIPAGIVTVGGEVRSFGARPDGTPWTVGIQNPRQKSPSDEVLATIQVSDRALSTSGDYNKYFEKDGVRYHHLLDPQTGYPSKQCGSTTIVAKDGVTADGFSKIFILGPDRGLEVARKLGFEVMYIDCNGTVRMSDGLKDKVTFLNK